MQQESGLTEGKSTIKAGKLIRIWARFRGKKIEGIRITGDFYIYPESAIEDLENELVGTSVEDSKIKIENVLKSCETLGIDADSLYRAVVEAWKSRK
ncbi:hypothetical protein AciM339_1434 [Aciduliprofundum sp. MAR08-339]|uniref:hypothetical protein n=1 Tax=Aciduliprofundum sp. (strain MAR08-339) TaxID=673860 RepID=UPI0002A47AD5|nr:hypothetical protein AciM339_1434 [Aciduliprofundum sp. MAR08-339]